MWKFVKRAMVFGIPTLLVGYVGQLGLGYRHIWQDEVETAVRAESILHSGLPKIFDPRGNVALNTGGMEIEDSDLHRYTPWIQFYWGALGLSFCTNPSHRAHQDRCLRVPFVLAHALSSGIMGYGFYALVDVNPIVAITYATLLGWQTPRLLHARTARYHSLLDLLTAIGILALGFLRIGFLRKRKVNVIWVSIPLLFLPHVHTLGGGLAGLLLLVIAHQVLSKQPERWKKIIPLFSALGIGCIFLLILSRPWAQQAWGPLSWGHLFRSLMSPHLVTYGIVVSLAFISYFWKKKLHSLTRPMSWLLFALVTTVGLLDFHPFSQSRYYLYLPMLLLSWPIYFGWGELTKIYQKRCMMLLTLSLLLPELVVNRYSPFQGVRIALSDFKHAQAGQLQPLHEALNIILKSEERGPVLIDYVPQFINWYLPGFKPALIPDINQKTKLGEAHPIWNQPLLLPRWHLSFPDWGLGFWNRLDQNDFEVVSGHVGDLQYFLHSKTLNQTVQLCRVALWSTHHWNNAPFQLWTKESFSPQGGDHERLVLSKSCPSKTTK